MRKERDAIAAAAKAFNDNNNNNNNKSNNNKQKQQQQANDDKEDVGVPIESTSRHDLNMMSSKSVCACYMFRIF